MEEHRGVLRRKALVDRQASTFRSKESADHRKITPAIYMRGLRGKPD